jgi:hypothetical protein
MNKPNNPHVLIGEKIKTFEGRTGIVDRIGGLTGNPWVLFPDNNISILVKWESILEVISENA